MNVEHKSGNMFEVVGQAVLEGKEHFIIKLPSVKFTNDGDVFYRNVLMPRHQFKVDNGAEWVEVVVPEKTDEKTNETVNQNTEKITKEEISP